MARKSLLHVQNGLHALQTVESDTNTDSVQRRSRPRKPHGNRRNTIVGIGENEIKSTKLENRLVQLAFTPMKIFIKFSHAYCTHQQIKKLLIIDFGFFSNYTFDCLIFIFLSTDLM